MDKYVPCDTTTVTTKTVQRAVPQRRSKVQVIKGETVAQHNTEQRTVRGD